jgi:DNA gyrase/topoisomerase IV subunit B
MPKKTSYSEQNITVVNIFDSMKKRPGMYLGDLTDGGAILNLIKDALQPALLAVENNQCKRINIVIEADKTIIITDDGPGLPIQPVDGTSELVKRLTQYTPAINHFGDINLDLITLCAYTDELSFTVHQDGHIWQQTLLHGKPSVVTQTGTTDRTGTCMELTINERVLPDCVINRDRIADYCRSLSYLYDQLHIEYTDHSVLHHSYHHRKGLAACVEAMYTNRHRNSKFQNLTELKSESKNLHFEAAITFTEEPGKQTCLVDIQRLNVSQIMCKALIAGMARAINQFTGSTRTPLIWHQLLRSHTYAAIRFKPTAQLKPNGRVLEKYLSPIIKKMTAETLLEQFNANPRTARSIIDILLHQKIRSEWQKTSKEYGVASSVYVSNYLAKHFKQPHQLKHIIEYYLEYERCLAACQTTT